MVNVMQTGRQQGCIDPRYYSTYGPGFSARQMARLWRGLPWPIVDRKVGGLLKLSKCHVQYLVAIGKKVNLQRL